MFAAVTLIAACITYVILEGTPFAKFYLARASLDHSAPDTAADSLIVNLDASPAVDGGDGSKASLLAPGGRRKPVVNTWSVVRRSWTMIATVFSVFFMTFLVFPSVSPSSTPYQNTLKLSTTLSPTWWNAILLLIFNLADTTGRFLSVRVVCKGVPFFVRFFAFVCISCAPPVRAHTHSQTHRLSHTLSLQLTTFIRYGFIVVFYGCAHSFSSGFFNDITLAVNMALFAITNGYMSSCT